MLWNMNDYPSSLKNLNKATNKKAIDIANGYSAHFHTKIQKTLPSK